MILFHYYCINVLETLHTFIFYPYKLRQGNSEFFNVLIKSYIINNYHFSSLVYAILIQEVIIKVQQPLLLLHLLY